MRKVDVLIVGAGPFGSVVAHHARKAGKSCLVIDKRNHVAGNCYTEKREGIDVHVYGPHIFHTDDTEVWQFVTSFGKFLPFVYSPIAIFEGRAYNLPFNMNTFTALFGTHDVKAVQSRITEEASIIKAFPRNMEEQAIKAVGTTVYEALIKGYTEKQWGRKCVDLPASIIKRLPVRMTFDNNYFNDPFQGIPEQGYTKLFESMLEGVDVMLDTSYEDIRGIEFGTMIYTGMIDEYFDYSLGDLEYRSLSFRHQVLDEKNAQGCAVFNYTSKNIPFTRVIEHKHFNPLNVSSKTIVTYETPTEYVKGQGMDPYYPIGLEKNRILYDRYKELADKEKKVIFGGRLGEYRYYDMDDTIRKALDLSSQLFGRP